MTPGASFRRILLPLDGSEPAASIVGYVGGLARRLSADTYLLGVAAPPPDDLPQGTADGPSPSLLMQYLEGIKEQLEAAGVSVVTDATTGRASAEITSYLAEQGCDLVAVATRARSASGPNLMGITTDRVVRSSPAPVLVVPPEETEESSSGPPKGAPQTVIAALDGSARGRSSVVPAAALAGALGAKLLLVRVAVPVDHLGGAATYHHAVTDHARQYLDGIAAELSGQGISVETRAVYGVPQKQLVSIADELPGSLLVMATRGWTNREDWALGSVTDRVVRAARHPVLVIPPGD